jgi:hypothetical protein
MKASNGRCKNGRRCTALIRQSHGERSQSLFLADDIQRRAAISSIRRALSGVRMMHDDVILCPLLGLGAISIAQPRVSAASEMWTTRASILNRVMGWKELAISKPQQATNRPQQHLD